MNWPWKRKAPSLTVVPDVPRRRSGLRSALNKAQSKPLVVNFPVKPPSLPPGVVPLGEAAPVMAMDSYGYSQDLYGGISDVQGFPGYPYLTTLSTRAEYRAFAAGISTELTREWISIGSSESAGDATKAKVTELSQAIAALGLRQVIQAAAEHDSYYGRGQILIEILGGKNGNLDEPLIISDKTITKGTRFRIKGIEPMWTTPVNFNASDPSAPDFYRPTMWYMLGKRVHSSRLLTIVTRPVPDMLKPSFNFSGMSMSQLAEPYVNNWLRTRQSVSDLVNNFSTTILATDMSQVLSGGIGDASYDDPSVNGTNLFARIDMFTATRSNKGCMVIDKEREEIVQVNTPLGGLDALQSQAQEHMCAVSRMPAPVLTGISPSGLNVSTEGEMAAWRDWVAAQQEAHYRAPIDQVIQIMQLCMYGKIDPDIHFNFNPLQQMTPKELSDIRQADSIAAGNYIDRGVIAPDEERERLAKNPESGYQGLDINREIEVESDEAESEDDEE